MAQTGRVIPNYRTAIPTAWTTVGAFRPMEAQLALAKLQSEGIPCTLADEHVANMAYPLIIDVKLQVMPDDLERAAALLKKRTPLPDVDPDEDYLDEAWRCGRCRSTNVGYVPLSVELRLLSLLLLGLPLLFIRRVKICQDCHHSWPA